MKRKQINKTIRVTVLILLLLAFGITGFYTVLIYRKPVVQKIQVPVYKVNQTGSVDYRVRLKPNNLYSKPVLESGRIYLANFIDKIEAEFKYTFTGQTVTKISGTYDIVAVIESYESLNQGSGTEKSVKVWEKEFPLVQKRKFDYKNRTGDFKSIVSIDYSFFTKFLEAVNKAAETNPGDARLLVKCNILTEASTPKGIMRDNIAPALIIPLGRKMFDIKTESPLGKPLVINSTKIIQNPGVVRGKIIFTTVSVALFILLLTVAFATKPVTEAPEYKMLEVINKKYGDRIVKTSGQDIAETDKTVYVDSLDGLVRVADEISKPIFHWKQTEGETHLFYIFDGTVR
ncbi:MAG: DUF5305 domain-containing protein, partial [Firmicutes bacterium]|nr:DUF5305 domain-containing protein [Bacillota bacterium]